MPITKDVDDGFTVQFVCWIEVSMKIQSEYRSSNALASSRDNIPKKILVADDDHAYRVAVKDVLELLGYEVMEASDTNEAMSVLEENNPDLMILDIKLPFMDGLSFVRKLRAKTTWSSTSIVISSGYLLQDQSREAIEAGANGVLPKPFNFDDLMATVEDFLGVEIVA